LVKSSAHSILIGFGANERLIIKSAFSVAVKLIPHHRSHLASDDTRHRSHLASDDTIRPPACPEIVLVCNEDVKPLRLQRIKHLPLQYMLNFYPNLLFFMPVSS
jgi:hypothetical protein